MKQARIYVDDRGYQGEDVDALEIQQGSLGNGWHNANPGPLHCLKFGDEATPIAGEINMKSHLDRIVARIRNKTLNAKRIVIELEEYVP